jgi:hypothetical protein
MASFAVFRTVGRYSDPRFLIEPLYQQWKGVYAWAHDIGGMLIPRRFGSTVRGSGRLGARFGLHNKRLGGEFKLDTRESRKSDA